MPRYSPAEKAVVATSWLSALLVPALVMVLLAYLAWRSRQAWSAALFFGDTPPLDAILRAAPVFDGLWPACVGTLMLVLMASVIAVPLGVASGIWLAEYARGKSKTAFSFCIDLLAGVPSIVVGLFGFALLLLMRKTVAPGANTGLLLSSLCLAVLVLPYTISATQLSLSSLPAGLRLTSAGLGLSRGQALGRILLPAAMPGIFGGIVLSVGRIAEDTAVILMTGAVANAGLPDSLTGKYEALPFHIYYLAAEHQSPEELAQAFAAALVLLCLTTVMLGCARLLRSRMERKWETGAMT
jgi:phosphate transport system permease protein